MHGFAYILFEGSAGLVADAKRAFNSPKKPANKPNSSAKPKPSAQQSNKVHSHLANTRDNLNKDVQRIAQACTGLEEMNFMKLKKFLISQGSTVPLPARLQIESQ